MIVRPGMLAVLLLVSTCASEARDDVHWIADETTANPGEALPPYPTVDKEIEVARFYVKKRDYTGAVNRCKMVVMHFPTSREAEEALFLLVAIFLELGIPHDAQTAAAVLGRKFPNSGWLPFAIRILKSADLEPEEGENSWISRALK
jgi:hypothetical protein